MESGGLRPDPPGNDKANTDQRSAPLGTSMLSDISWSAGQVAVDKTEMNCDMISVAVLSSADHTNSLTGYSHTENSNQSELNDKSEMTNLPPLRVISHPEVCPQPMVNSEPLTTDQSPANPSPHQQTTKDSEIDKVLASGRRPFEVVLKGGTPWGFALNGGRGTKTPLHISKIVPGGKASDSALVEKDYVLRINDVPCSDVGQALDIVDTAFMTLTITVLRGSWECPKQQTHQARPTDFRRKEYRGQRHSDDSIVYTQSKSSQATSMRPSRRRGESFNVGKLGGVPPDKGVTSRGHSSSSDPPWGLSGGDKRRSAPNDVSGAGVRYRESHWSSAGQSRNPQDHLANVNRRRSDGQSLASSPGSSNYLQQQQQRQLLLSMKSSPNLTKPDGSDADDSVRMSPRSQTHMMSTKSSPNLLDDLGHEASDVRYSSQGMLRSTSDHNVKQGVYVNTSDNGSRDYGSGPRDYGSGPREYGTGPREYGSQVYSPDMYTSDMNTTAKQVRRSLPAHSLYRYQPDYENVSHLGTAPLRSEKISEIDDIDEVTGRESVPQSPDTQSYNNPMGGAGLPTRDPASLKYIKVNQNHEKYPSWPVTKSNGASEQTQPINTRAQSMTDNTNTSKEFPQKQRLAYTPGLRTLAEKNSPLAERKAEEGKGGRNTSDPGLKSEFVYDRFGRVHKRNYDSVENKFEDFYKNSKSGYPPPKMDPDGNNIGDKNYNAPSPPERESKGVDHQELSARLGAVGDASSHHQPNYGEPVSRFSNTQQYLPYHAANQVTHKTGASVRPSNLNIQHGNLVAEQSSSRMDSSTSPLEVSPLSYNNREIRSDSQGDSGQQASSQSRPRSYHDQYKQASPLQSWVDKTSSAHQQSPSSASNIGQSPSSQTVLRARQSPKMESPVRPSSSGEFSTQSGIHQDARHGSEKSKSYIVKSTPYYNTSTQTEMMPYAIKVSIPSVQASKLRHAETQVGEFGTQTSPKAPDDQKKMFEEKSIQARMSRDFHNADLDSNFEKKFPTDLKKPRDEVFKFPSSNSMKPSQYTGIHDIQAKYATDESPNTNSGGNHSKNSVSPFMDNSASILRKLSEEFYGNRLGLSNDKRLSSSSSQEQSQSPKYDAATAGTALQPGLREAESYSSVVIHHDQTAGLFGRDDYGSVSSIADVSSVFSDASSSHKTDSSSSRTRRSLDPALMVQKSRFQQSDPRTFSSTSGFGHHRETSAPVISSSNLSRVGANQPSPTGPAKPYSLVTSDLSSTSVRPGSSSEPRHSQVSTFTNNSESLSGQGPQVPPTSSSSAASSTTHITTSSATLSNKQPGFEEQRSNRRDSDSVFINTDDDLSDYQFNRKPSLRKAYGIYDETERLISQNSASQSKLLGKGKEFSGQDGSAYVPMSRSNKFSDSLGLGLIQEEDHPHSGEDAIGQRPSGHSVGALDERPGVRRDDQVKYVWQNEAWRKSQTELLKGSNLKRTTSEQIPTLKPSMLYKPTSYDTEAFTYDPATPTFPGPSPHTVDYPASHNHTSSDYGSSHSRTQSEDLSLLSNEPELKKFQQQAVLSFYQRKIHSGAPSRGSHLKGTGSTDSSMYESIEGSHSESVADIISKANENLAKSAQRVDSIRRSNSTSSRSSDYMDMAKHDRMRRETDWSRLRSSGSLRYSPDHDRRSNRSSFASENHYEDISLFSPSTPRDSIADSVDINLDTGNANASMDSGLVGSPTYQNFPNRRPPPPVPRSPSPDAPPPALPPRNYRESDSGSNTVHHQETSRPPLSPNDKHRISTIPLGKQAEYPQVEVTKRDFKSLMSQWENSSPREDKYAAELRKQAQKLTGQQQQQQHSNAMPMALLHSRTKVSLATTFKREPMLPQEATSPSASTSSLASSHTGSSTSPTASSSHFQASSASTRQLPQQHPHTTNDQDPAPTNNPGNAPYISNIKVSYGQTTATAAPQVPERIAEDARHRSSSEVVNNNNHLPGMSGKSGRPAEHALRDRSASDHNVLSDRRHQPQETHFGASAEGAPIAITKWRHASGSSTAPPPGSEDGAHFVNDSSTEDGFAEESYIGHKNKSSRAIGTYQRSKSAVVLQGAGHSLEEDDQKLGQQSWSSESVLVQGQTTGAEPSTGSNSHNDKAEAIPEHNTPAPATAPPVRPARPSTYGRHGNAGGSAPPSASTAQPSSVSTTPPAGPSPSVFSAKPVMVEQSGWIARRDSPRRHPDSSDPNPVPSQWHGQGQLGSNSEQPSYRWPVDDNPRAAPPSVIQSQYSPQRRVASNDNAPSPHWSAANGMNYKQAPVSSSPDSAYAKPGEPLSPTDDPPVALPPRDYIRRESAPVKSAPSASFPDNKLNVSSDASRRRSDSSVTSTAAKSDNSDVSSSVHSRQPSQEELECDEKAKQLAQELSEKDQKLSEVLRLDSTRKRMQYMDGLFPGAEDGSGSQEKPAINPETRSSSVRLTSPQHQKHELPEIKKRGSLPKEYWMSPSKAMLEMELRRNEDVGKDITKDINDSNTLMKQKEELMDKLHKKLEVLKEAKVSLQKEIADNEELGKQVHRLVDTNGWLTQNEKDKVKAYIDDLEKIVRLLLNLSGQLARAENAVQALPPDADAKLRKMTIDKRERLSAKHEEAKLLKDDIDKRSEQLSQILQDRLNEVEFSDYSHYIKMKSKLTIELQELDDKITLGGEQIIELKKSIPDQSES